MASENHSRESVGSRLGFIMMAAGCAIGLGNVWRFPFVAGQYGGACFVLLYLIFLLILGFPVMVMELALGRGAKRGLYGAYKVLSSTQPSPWRVPGAIAFSGNLILMMMYTTVCGWMLAYCWAYLEGSLSALTTTEQTGEYFSSFLASPARMSFFMLLSVGIGTAVCAAGLRNGVERVTKVLMSGMFALLLGLAGYSLFLPGAGDGLRFYLEPRLDSFNGIFAWRAVSAAMSQAFFTLSLGVGSIAIFGSYIDRKNSLTGEALWIIVCDTVTALLAGVVIFCACSSYGVKVDSGPGLVLVSLTNVFNHMHHGRLLGFLFFLFLSVAALTTVIAVFENLIAFLIDECGITRRKAAGINGILLAVLSFPCILGYNLLKNFHPLGGNSTVLDFEDWLISDTLLPLGALLIVFFCILPSGWGWKKFITEANAGKGLPFPAFAKYYIFGGIPLLILLLYALGVYGRFFAR